MDGRRKKSNIFALAGALVALAVLAMPMSAAAWTVTPTNSAETLVNNILGTGVSLVPGSALLTGVNNQQGTFTASPIGFKEGIILTSGNATNVPGSNAGQSAETLGVGNTSNDNFSVDLEQSGYVTLGGSTYDANVLSFKFTFDGDSSNNSLYFNYIFASEEYVDYVNSQYNDVFALYVDGVNIAIVAGETVAINNINPTKNSAYYINNVANTNGYGVANTDTKFDGYTTVLTAQKLGLDDGEHTMVFAVADVSDGILDAGVLIQKGTFSSEYTPVPEPMTIMLLGIGLMGLTGARKFKK